MNLVLARPRGFWRHVDLTVGAANHSNSNRLSAGTINTLRRPAVVEVSTFPGREEHIEFRQARRLALA
jgi:hypothetical protein